MDLKTNNKTIKLNDIIYDKKNEYGVDCEFTLPDYCPDIERILKCEITPRLTDLNVLSDTAQIEICAVIGVLYATSDSTLFGYEMPINISKNVNIGLVEKEVSKSAVLSSEYVNCRAINKRKIDVHGSVCAEIKISQNTDCEYISEIEQDSVVLKRTNKRTLQTKGFCEKQINVSDDVAIPQSMGSIVNIIRQDARVVVDECKGIAGKAIAKICVYYEILYLNEKDKYECLKHKIPASAIIDIDGIDENCVCSSFADICSNSIKATANADGEMRTLNISSKVNLSVNAYCFNDISVVSDGYCVKYESEVQKQQIPVCEFIADINETANVSENIELGSSIKEVLDIWCKPINHTLQVKDNSAIVSGDMSVCVAVSDEKDNVKFYEKILPYKQVVHEQINADLVDSNISVCPCFCSYNITGENCIDIKIQLSVTGLITRTHSLPIVTKMTVDQTRKKSFDTLPALTVYYASKGEKLWDIALKYNTSTDAIVSANSIDCDELDKDTILLIPSI